MPSGRAGSSCPMLTVGCSKLEVNRWDAEEKLMMIK